MPNQDELSIEGDDRVALERERQRLAKSLYEKGVITPEAFARTVAEPQVFERQSEDAV
jgi:hypothetical protein